MLRRMPREPKTTASRGRRHLVLACLLACAPSAARAQATDASNTDAYPQLIGQAVDEYNHANWAEARALFAQAHAIQPSARTQRGLGLSAFELRDYVDAIAHLRDALADQRNALSPEQRDEVGEVITRAQRYVGAVHVEIVPNDAELLINGQRADKLEFELNVGDYDFAAKAPGYANAALKVNVQGGRANTLRLELVPMKDAAPPAPARSSGVGPAGASAATQSSIQPILGWTAIGLSAASLAVGVALEIERGSDLSRRDAICRTGTESDCDDRAQSRVDALTTQARTASTIGTVALITSAAFAAGGIALLLTAPSDERAEQVTLAPVLGPVAQGVMLSARAW
jgi:hypothetical protein